MQFQVAKKTLVRVLERAASVASKNPMHGIDCVNITVDSDAGVATFATTDLFLQCIDHVTVAEEIAGSVSIRCRALLDRIKGLDDGDILLKVKDSIATVRTVGQKRTFQLSCLPGDEFPKLSWPSQVDERFTIVSNELSRALDCVTHAVAADITRPALNSVKFDLAGSNLTLAAADGHRLARAIVSTAAENGDATHLEMTVPFAGVRQIKRLADSLPADSEVTISTNGVLVSVSCGSCVVSAKLTDAQFPTYEAVIPKQNSIATVTVSGPRLIASLKAASISSGDSQRVDLRVTNGELVITAESPDNGIASDEVPCEATGNTPFSVCSRYLVEALAQLGETCRIKYFGDLDPVVIEPGAVSSGLSILQLVMPMRS